MTTLFRVLLGVSVLLSVAFLVALGRPSRHQERGIAWFLAAAAWAGLSVDGVLFAAVLGAGGGQWMVWLLAGFLAFQDLVFGWRLWLVLRSARMR
jgi:hypothetical protein